ncbi:MAG TPA: dihydroorotate dehydrogenase electron transfer subunit [Candidatus Udaeobacter sp.]|nr:dihydroorotate dehydrogenase electron transfer subunit [Candidatus Udaeobacter sp.]
MGALADSRVSAAWMQARARVRRQLVTGPDYRWLEVDVPPSFPRPRPGQFIQLLLAAPCAVLLPRPMSVASAESHDEGVTIGFLYTAVGTGTRLLSALSPGDEVEVLGPLGRGFPLEQSGIPVLIAGGRGVAPLIFAAQALAQTPADSRGASPCEFLFGARSADLLVGLESAQSEIARIGGRLHLATDDGSRGTRGNVIDLLDRIVPSLGGTIVIHACGPHAMLKAVARWALARSVPAWLAMESVMACGTGVCRGCPLPRSETRRSAFDPDGTPSLFGNHEYAMCCTEGPVFEAGDLDWSRIE